MTTFIGRRTLESLFSLVGLLVLVFFLVRLTGDPTNLYLPLNASEEMRLEFAERNGYTDPVMMQFGRYLADLSRFNLGTSLQRQQPALEVVLEAFPTTLKLASVTMLTALTLAIIVGSLAAYRPDSFFDRAASTLSLLGASAPDFWLAIMAILLFSVQLGWLPTSGTGTPAHWVLPIFILLLRPFGLLVQIVRKSMIGVLNADFVRTARAKGVRERAVVFFHALRNASLATVTVAGDQAVGLINGAVIVETIFAWPGVGKVMIDSIVHRDFAVVQAAVLVTALAIFLLNILIDVAYAVLDPRIRYG